MELYAPVYLGRCSLSNICSILMIYVPSPGSHPARLLQILQPRLHSLLYVLRSVDNWPAFGTIGKVIIICAERLIRYPGNEASWEMHSTDSVRKPSSSHTGSTRRSSLDSVGMKATDADPARFLEDGSNTTPSAMADDQPCIPAASLPINWPARKKWCNLLLISTLTLLT